MESLARSASQEFLVEALSCMPPGTESSKRLCMRKKKKQAGPVRGELAFLKKRRASVEVAAAKASAETAPRWMKALSSRLWTGSHRKEVDFNRAKLKTKRVVAFKAGSYVPRSRGEKRALEGASREYEQREKKARHDWEKNIARRRCGAMIAHK